MGLAAEHPMKILLLADGSKHAARAARYLAAHLSDYASPPAVRVLTVHRPLPYPHAAAVVGRKAIETYQREECEAALAPATRVLDKAGIAYGADWRLGEPVDEIAAYVKRNRIDLVVMGSHGHGAIANLALGSTTTKVLAVLKAPVLIIR